MTSPMKHTKEELIREISTSWSELNTLLDNLSDEQIAHTPDAEGWTVLDHVNHIAAWERSVVYYLQGKPRYEGLGVDKALFVQGNDDSINAAIQKQTAAFTRASALESLRETHKQLLTIGEGMSDADLNQTREQFSASPEEKGDTRILLGLIYTNTAQHYREHLGWIKTLVGAA
ncbi:MAG: ClbS/DfsB family four-helix bundle protein [Chloroflexota bacterium]